MNPVVAVAWLALWWTPVRGLGQSTLSTGITGRVTGVGLADPQYVLAFPQVQSLMLRAVDGPLPEATIRTALEGSAVELHHLLDHGLLEPTVSDRYRLSYLLLTVEDQREIYQVAERLGADLARTIASRADDFHRLLAGHPQPELRGDLLFALVAGFLLNWDGLAVSTELGYRVEHPLHTNGDRYLVHSSENGAALKTKGLYSGSHTYPGPNVSFSTFGDGPSQPRIGGIPDSYTEPVQAGFELLADTPSLLGGLQARFLAFVTRELDALGELMMAVAEASGAIGELATRTEMDRDEAEALVKVLEATGYVVQADGRYRPGVAVLTAGDRAMVEGVSALGREILTAWLLENHARMERDLSGLSPMKNGVPFELAFSEVWHWVFGHATRALALEGFYTDPYERAEGHEGFVPLVWASSLRPPPS